MKRHTKDKKTDKEILEEIRKLKKELKELKKAKAEEQKAKENAKAYQIEGYSDDIKERNSNTIEKEKLEEELNLLNNYLWEMKAKGVEGSKLYSGQKINNNYNRHAHKIKFYYKVIGAVVGLFFLILILIVSTPPQINPPSNSSGVASLYHLNYTINDTIIPPPQNYTVIFPTNYNVEPSNFSINRVYLNTEYRSPPQPTGIVSYGLFEGNGMIQTYQIETSEIGGIVRIYSISAYNATPPANISLSGASLQLNAVLVIHNYNGSQIVLWPQNALIFDTNQQSLLYQGSFTLLSSGNVKFINSASGGCQENNASMVEYFNCYTSTKSYDLPITLFLYMNASVIPGEGVLLNYNVLNVNSIKEGLNESFNWTYNASNPFESITFLDPNAEYAYFLVSGYNYTPSMPSTEYYDAEFVFGGEGNGEQTYFNSLNAELNLMYYNTKTNSFSDFPSFYTFGSDTAEGADNLQVSGLNDSWANAYVTTGTPDYNYLNP
ncbi:MAG: thermopsin family protease [Candidatus Micrarchaeaceae archaeon]